MKLKSYLLLILCLLSLSGCGKYDIPEISHYMINAKVLKVENNEVCLYYKNEKYTLPSMELSTYCLNRKGEYIPCELEVLTFDDGRVETRISNILLDGRRV